MFLLLTVEQSQQIIRYLSVIAMATINKCWHLSARTGGIERDCRVQVVGTDCIVGNYSALSHML